MDVQQVQALVGELVVPMVVGLVALVLRPLVAQAVTWLKRSALYGAVKIGLNYAASQGLTPETAGHLLRETASRAAQAYLKRFGIAVDVAHLLELLEAELFKRAQAQVPEAQLVEAGPLEPNPDLVRALVVQTMNEIFAAIAAQRQQAVEQAAAVPASEAGV